jgi:flagellar motor switch protein FliM
MTQLPGGKIESDVIRRITSRLGVGRPTREDPVTAVDYDWRQCHHYGPAAVGQLKEAITKAGSAVADKLTDLFHAKPDITVESLEQSFAKEALEAAAAGGAWTMNLNRQKGKNCGVMAIGMVTAGKWVSQLLGDDSTKREEGKELSELEQTLLVDLTFAIGQSFSQALAASKAPQIAAETQMSKNLTAQLDPMADACRITLTVKTANDSSKLDIVLLCDVLDPVVGMDQSAAGLLPERVKAMMMECIKPSPVVINATLGGASISIKDIADLKAGDVLVLARSIDEPIEVFMNGKELCVGQLAEYEGRYAVVASQAAVAAR